MVCFGDCAINASGQILVILRKNAFIREEAHFRNDESLNMQQDALLIAMQINQTGAPATIA